MNPSNEMRALGDQVRRLTGLSGWLDVPGMTAALAEVQTGTDASEATAEAEAVLAGEKFIGAAGVLEVGTMPDRGAVSVTLDGTTTSYTVPEGRHDGTGTVKVQTQTKSVTPSSSAQTVNPDSGYLLSSVTVAAAAINGKQVYTGTVTLSVGSSVTSFNVDTGVQLASADTFILLPITTVDMTSVTFNYAVRRGTAESYIHESEIYEDSEDSYSVQTNKRGSVTVSGTKATIRKDGILSFFGSARWFVIKE